MKTIWTWIGPPLALFVTLLGVASRGSVPVTVVESDTSFTLANGSVSAVIEKRTGILTSLRYAGLEFLAHDRGGALGGYWSSVGRGRPGAKLDATIRISPSTNGGERAEISCRLHNPPGAPDTPIDADYRYALGRDEQWLYVYSILTHRPGYPAFGVGEARYCLKLNPDIFDYMSIDAERRRLMPSGYDWDHGAPLNLKEARRMTTGMHAGEAEHKYDYSAVLADTPAYGWSSTRQRVGLWMINPSLEYLGGGPTKAELTGHRDVNPGGLPTLLNMWVGSHYGGTTISVAPTEAWTKVVGPFVLYCNSVPEGPVETTQKSLWLDALERAAKEAARWPYGWLADSNYPPAAARGVLSGEIVLRDRFAPNSEMTNLWVGLSAPDYTPPPRFGAGFGGRFTATNAARATFTNAPGQGFGGFPLQVDWQRDAKFYQFWSRADPRGRFTIPNIRPGNYTLHAIADGVLGELTRTNISIASAERKTLGRLEWTPTRFGRTVWEIGVPDRTAREFRHGDHYWQWGLYFDYPKEFPNDVNFVVGKSDWKRDWNFVQPPRIEEPAVPGTAGSESDGADGAPQPRRGRERNIRPTTWSITFVLPEAGRGQATLRLAFCGTHVGCNVEAFVGDRSIGETGPLPSTSAMQRDAIRAYWIEKDIGFDASLLKQGTNVIRLRSHANSWAQGVLYDYLRLEMNDGRVVSLRERVASLAEGDDSVPETNRFPAELTDSLQKANSDHSPMRWRQFSISPAEGVRAGMRGQEVPGVQIIPGPTTALK